MFGFIYGSIICVNKELQTNKQTAPLMILSQLLRGNICPWLFTIDGPLMQHIYQGFESKQILFDHTTCTLVIMKVIHLLNIEIKDDFCQDRDIQ